MTYPKNIRRPYQNTPEDPCPRCGDTGTSPEGYPCAACVKGQSKGRKLMAKARATRNAKGAALVLAIVALCPVVTAWALANLL